MRKIYLFVLTLFLTLSGYSQAVLYSNDFEVCVGDVVIIGNGAVEEDITRGLGNTSHNAVDKQEIRKNYLLLPATIFNNLVTSGANCDVTRGKLF